MQVEIIAFGVTNNQERPFGLQQPPFLKTQVLPVTYNDMIQYLDTHDLIGLLQAPGNSSQVKVIDVHHSYLLQLLTSKGERNG